MPRWEKPLCCEMKRGRSGVRPVRCFGSILVGASLVPGVKVPARETEAQGFPCFGVLRVH